MPLSIAVADDQWATTVTVRGEIDLETTADLSSALANLKGSSAVHLDLTGVDYMDSTGLRALLLAKEEAERDGRTLQVTAASNIVTRLIEITGVNGLLAAAENTDDES